MRFFLLFLFLHSWSWSAVFCSENRFVSEWTQSIFNTSKQPVLVWDVLVNNFKLNDEYDHPKVKAYTYWLKNNPKYLTQIFERSREFLPLIIGEIKSQNLPLDLVFLPFLESSFLPYAVSEKNAKGIWQFLESTAREFHLTINEWYDGRQDFLMSTRAAIHFLKYLHTKTNDWLLAIASYNAGLSVIQNLHTKSIFDFLNPSSPYWGLDLPTETKRYVPNFLAITKWIKNNSKDLPAIPYCKTLDVLSLKNPVDLYDLAELLNVRIEEIYYYNPALQSWMTPPNMEYNLLLPLKWVRFGKLNILKRIEKMAVKPILYVVKKDDNLTKIAQTHNATINEIMDSNNLKNHVIDWGQTLQIYQPKKNREYYTLSRHNREKLLTHLSVKGAKKTLHTIQKKENLWSIAKIYSMPVDQLAAMNHLSVNEYIIEGEKLLIFQSTQSNIVMHWVVSGSSIETIALRYCTTVSDIIEANQLIGDIIYPGQILRIPICKGDI